MSSVIISICILAACLLYGTLLHTSNISKKLKMLITILLILVSSVAYRTSSNFYGNPLETSTNLKNVTLLAYYPQPPDTMYLWYIDNVSHRPVSIQVPYDFKAEGELSKMLSGEDGTTAQIDMELDVDKTNPLVRMVKGVKISKSKKVKHRRNGRQGRGGAGSDGIDDVEGSRQDEVFPMKIRR